MNTAASKSRRQTWIGVGLGTLIALALVTVAMVASPFRFSAADVAAVRLQAPHFDLITRESLTLKVHLFAALTALGIGITIMLKPKGVGLHKALGWSWVIAMAVTAVSSFFLTGLNGDRLSLIHLLSGWVVVALPIAVTAIRRRNVNMHRRMMTGLFVGGLLIAGGLTFIPGRLMWQVFFG